MALSNPWYIDAEARHLPNTIRLLSYMASEGKEGVGAEGHLAVTDLDTPGASINVAPGSYAIVAKHTGGSFESYVGKVAIQETVSVNPTSSGGPRTDLVILRVENPYVVGSGSWAQPPDPLNGPYAYVRVIEGVPANTNSVQAVNATWSAITLARITRPSSTGIVSQSHITDLRSLAKLGGERVIIIDDPPVDPPPITQAFFLDAKNFSGSEQTMGPSTGSYTHFPTQADWQVPVPSWACGVDVMFQVNNLRLETAGALGNYRINIDNGTVLTPATGFDLSHNRPINGWERHPLFVAATVLLPASLRGKMIRFKAEMQITVNDGGTLKWVSGCSMSMWAVFKQFPITG